MIEVVEAQRPITKRYRICREYRTSAGIATEAVGLYLHAYSPERAIEHAVKLYPWLSGKLVALPEES